MVEKMSLLQRLGAPTPTFFKKVRNTGLVLSAIGGAILSAPVSLPVIVVKIAGYLATAGVVASAVSQAAVDEQKLEATPATIQSKGK